MDLATFHYGDWLKTQGLDFKTDRHAAPMFGEYYAYQCTAIDRYFAELASYARDYGQAQGRQVLVSGNFFNLDPHYLPLADNVDLIITEMRNTSYRQPEWYRYVDGFARFAGGKDVVVVENPYGGVVPELADLLGRGKGYDLLRLSLFEGAAFGANMTVPYGSWMGSRIQDSFWAPHDLLAEVQSFLADSDHLLSTSSGNEIAVVYSIPSNRELVSRADASDNVLNARDASVVVPYRVVTETLSHSSAPFDVVLFTDGRIAEDRVDVADLRRYSVVVLPACWWLSTRQVDAMVDYLDGGGRVVVTGVCASNLGQPDRDRLLNHPGVRRSLDDDAASLQPLGPQVSVDAELAVNLHSLSGGTVAVHLVNYCYVAADDAVVSRSDVEVTVRLRGSYTAAAVIRPGRPDGHQEVSRSGDSYTVRLDEVNVYAVVVLHDGSWSRAASGEAKP
jgi:hypothetical protein